MADVIREWAGKERLFRLNLGEVLDLEQATGVGIGALFIRIANGQYHALDVFHTIRLGLIGAGMGKLDAKRLMDNHFDRKPYVENAVLAGEIIAAVMVGVEPAVDDEDEAAPEEPLKFSEISQVCQVFNVSPVELRAMAYADFVNMVRGYNAAGNGRKVSTLSEEEFAELLNKYQPVDSATPQQE